MRVGTFAYGAQRKTELGEITPADQFVATKGLGRPAPADWWRTMQLLTKLAQVQH